MNINLNTIYYYIINDDLKMSKGKIAAQVSHVAMKLGENYGEIGRAIVLKASEQLIRSILTMTLFQPVYSIEDAGFTEVPKGSLTCIGFVGTEKRSKLMKTLKLV